MTGNDHGAHRREAHRCHIATCPGQTLGSEGAGSVTADVPDDAHRGLAQNPIGVPVLIAIERASEWIDSIWSDPGFSKGQGVGDCHVPTISIQDHRAVVGGCVQDVSIRQVSLGEGFDVQADANQCLAWRQVRDRLSHHADQIVKVGSTLDDQTFERARIADRVEVGISKTRDKVATRESLFDESRCSEVLGDVDGGDEPAATSTLVPSDRPPTTASAVMSRSLSASRRRHPRRGRPR